MKTNRVFRLVSPVYDMDAYIFKGNVPTSIVVKCEGVVLRVVVCGVVLVVSCVVLFLLCFCVCDLFVFLQNRTG